MERVLGRHHLQRARALIGLGALEEGEQELSRAELLAPFFPERLRWIGGIRLRLHVQQPRPARIAAAMATYRRLLEVQPGALRDVFRLMDQVLKTLHERQFELLLPEGERGAPLRRGVTTLLLSSGRASLARRVFEPLAGEGALPADLERYAELSLRCFEPFAAQETYLRAAEGLEAAPRRELAQRAGRSLKAAGYARLGVQLLETILARDPAGLEVRLALAEAYLASGREDEGLAELRRCHDAGSAKASALLGDLYRRRQQRRAALRTWREALERPRLTLSERLTLTRRLAALLVERGERDEALALVREALRLVPDDAGLLKLERSLRAR